MQEANENLKENKVQSAQRNIAEGLDIIKNRQKLIKLADSSEAGWRAVDEYTKNPIASDSEDEKKICKAQTRAERKVKEAKAKKRKDFRDSARPYQKPSWSQTSADNTTWKSGHCYRCNKRGHWRKDCTEKLNGDKISTTVTEVNHLISQINNETPIGNTNKSQSCIKNISPVGRLRENLGHWRSIGVRRDRKRI